jgi:glutaredoxin
MKAHTVNASKNIATYVGLTVTVALLSINVGAQQLYRILGADGRVTFSDRPPADANAKVTTGKAALAGGDTANANLPSELRAVVSRYPVTLYTSKDCGPCASGRALLTARGVPFAEKIVNTNDDVAALQRISGDNSMPFLTIGGQQIKGYSDSEWTETLSAAGYPTSSQLPANYRQAPAAPLVVAQKAEVAAKPAEAASAPVAARPAARPSGRPDPNNPTGIQF